MTATDFLTLADLDRDALLALLDASAGYKRARPHGPADWLAGLHVALVMEKASTRTRVAFEVAVRELGGHATLLTVDGSQLARGEPIADTARVLDRFCHAIVYRTSTDDRLHRMADAARAPVINALTDREHPCQIVADLLTVREHKGRLDVAYAWIGDGNNMAHSWLHAAGILGLRLTLACPETHRPDPAIVAAARAAGATVELVARPDQAVAGADVVMTDVWASMGQEHEQAARGKAFAGYLVDEALLAGAAADAIVLHCLPAHRGEEIAAEVIDGPRGRAIWDQAENRLHTHKAILERAFTGAARGPGR
ncbi:MAG TPA: ornithine carbamoyltransferase [Kofleriaceae bacterium]|nr:ornithine carbamoyltransferase [Kofleriaceae bacterium]